MLKEILILGIGGDGVQLSEDDATRFYIAMPEAAYDSLTITVTVDSGDPFIFKSNKPVEIKKSNIYIIPAIVFNLNNLINF